MHLLLLNVPQQTQQWATKGRKMAGLARAPMESLCGWTIDTQESKKSYHFFFHVLTTLFQSCFLKKCSFDKKSYVFSKFCSHIERLRSENSFLHKKSLALQKTVFRSLPFHIWTQFGEQIANFYFLTIRFSFIPYKNGESA